MIKPTIGRVVLVYRPGKSDQFEPALITYVWSDTAINVGGFDRNGVPFAETSLHLDQDIQVDPIALPKFDAEEALEPFACWMPYQKAAQAAQEAKKNPTSPQIAAGSSQTASLPASLAGGSNQENHGTEQSGAVPASNPSA